jgi:adenylosuccinate lyase
MLIYPQRMRANLDLLGGLVHSQRVLLALTQKGVSREDAYRIVQSNAMKIWAEGGTFQEKLLAEPEVAKRLKPDEIRGLFDDSHHFRQVDTIFRRVFGRAGPKAPRSLGKRR